LKPDPVVDPTDLRLKPGRVEEKIKKKKTRCDLVKPNQKLGCNPLIFVFLLKQRRFDLKNLIRLKPGTPALNKAGSENMLERF